MDELVRQTGFLSHGNNVALVWRVSRIVSSIYEAV